LFALTKVQANAFIILPNAFWTFVRIKKYRTRSFCCIALCETR